jgi:hypothetical protein
VTLVSGMVSIRLCRSVSSRPDANADLLTALDAVNERKRSVHKV